jgi:L,D-transpeptidase ErfK/SrfK
MRSACLLILLLAASGAAAPQSAPSLSGAPVSYRAVKGDSLEALGSRFGVDVATLARRNGLKPTERLTPGQTLRIDAVHIAPASLHTIVVNLPQRMLFVSDGATVEGFPVAVGRASWPTPLGSFTVERKEEDPTWDVPVSIQEEMRRTGKPVLEHVPPSPDNPLGRFWLGTSLTNIGIHGTNAPRSIHRAVTHGCIRVHPDRIGELFNLVPEGTSGEIVYQPLLLAVADGRVYVEVNPDVYHRQPVTLARLGELAVAAELTSRIDWTLAAEAIALREGVAVDVSRQ